MTAESIARLCSIETTPQPRGALPLPLLRGGLGRGHLRGSDSRRGPLRRSLRKNPSSSLRGAKATKQSMAQQQRKLDCFVASAPRNDVKMRLRDPAARCARVMHESFALKSEGVGNAGRPMHSQPRVRYGVTSMHTRTPSEPPESPGIPARNGPPCGRGWLASSDGRRVRGCGLSKETGRQLATEGASSNAQLHVGE
jgi:hypothetical protein